MRIISSFHDYYDIGMQYGQDELVTWVRETESIKCDTQALGIYPSWFKSYTIGTKKHRFSVKPAYLAFCGKVIPLHIGTECDYYNMKQSSKSPIYEYSKDGMINRFLKWLERHGENLSDMKYMGDEKDYDYLHGGKGLDQLDQWLNTPCHKLHSMFDCPVLLISENNMVKCPNLSKISLQLVKDPYTVFQEIGMYISGVMGQKCNPMVTLSDKSKVLKHGFCPKYGFRKRPKEKNG